MRSDFICYGRVLPIDGRLQLCLALQRMSCNVAFACCLSLFFLRWLADARRREGQAPKEAYKVSLNRL